MLGYRRRSPLTRATDYNSNAKMPAYALPEEYCERSTLGCFMKLDGRAIGRPYGETPYKTSVYSGDGVSMVGKFNCKDGVLCVVADTGVKSTFVAPDNPYLRLALTEGKIEENGQKNFTLDPDPKVPALQFRDDEDKAAWEKTCQTVGEVFGQQSNGQSHYMGYRQTPAP